MELQPGEAQTGESLELAACLSYFSVSVMKTLSKATYRGKSLFEHMAPGSRVIMAERHGEVAGAGEEASPQWHTIHQF